MIAAACIVALVLLAALAMPKMAASNIADAPPRKVKARPRYAKLPDGTDVEPVCHPLFSSVYLPAGQLGSASPSELTFFGYGVGDSVPGLSGVVARNVHTNMDRGGVLAEPKHFVCTGVRFFVNPLAFDTSGTPSLANSFSSSTDWASAAALEDDGFMDLQRIVQGSVLTIEHQDKIILEQPTFTCPANYGMGGVLALSMITGASQALTQFVQASAAGTSGLPSTFGGRGWVIKPGESFSVRLSYPHKNSSSGMVTTDGKLLVCVLDGQQLRARR